ncbi:ORF3 [chu-like virus 1]|nr:ORF3 [chu-like virus 1]
MVHHKDNVITGRGPFISAPYRRPISTAEANFKDILIMMAWLQEEKPDYPEDQERTYRVYKIPIFNQEHLLTNAEILKEYPEQLIRRHPTLDEERIRLLLDAVEFGELNISEVLSIVRPVGLVEVVYTDLPSCVSLVRGLPNLAATTEPLLEVPGNDDFHMPRRLISYRYTTTLPSGRLKAFLPSPALEPPENPLSTSLLYVRASWLYRPYRTGSTGLNKFYEIMSWLGVSKLPNNRYYLCLAEGHGGFAAGICSMTQNSIIAYNTLLADGQSTVRTADLEQHCTLRGNTLDRTLMEQGNNNLASRRTANNYSAQAYRCPLITADPNKGPSYQTVITHCIEIYLNLRSDKGTLILKAFVDEWETLNQIVVWLRDYCSRVMCIKPRSSHDNKETYIIAHGTRKVYNNSGLPDIYPDLKECRVIAYHVSHIH